MGVILILIIFLVIVGAILKAAGAHGKFYDAIFGIRSFRKKK